MRRSILEEINYSALALLQTVDLERRYEIAIREAARIVGVEHGTIFIYRNGNLERVYSNVPTQQRIPPRKRGFTYQTYLSGEIHVMTPGELKEAHPSLYSKGVHSLLLIPLSINDQNVGVLSLQIKKSRKFSDQEKHALKLFGTFTTVAIRNSYYYEQTKKSIEARDLFISLASHELKTPLTTISVYSDLISKKINSKQTPSENMVDILKFEIKRLKNIINDLLEFDQIVSGQLRFRWGEVNIIDVIKKSRINFRTTNPKYKVVLENNLPRGFGTIYGDAEKLQQAISNILINAAKFSTPFTPILIQMESDKKKLYISISDYGKGIRKNEQEKIFNEFYKGDTNKKRGMGLGLYLVRRIVEKHRGDVEVFSKLHKGTKITIKLPIKNHESRN